MFRARPSPKMNTRCQATGRRWVLRKPRSNWIAPPLRVALVLTFLAAAPSALLAQPGRTDTSFDARQLVTAANDAEKRGDWAEACRAYEQILKQDRNQPELRQAYQRCLRQYHL